MSGALETAGRCLGGGGGGCLLPAGGLGSLGLLLLLLMLAARMTHTSGTYVVHQAGRPGPLYLPPRYEQPYYRPPESPHGYLAVVGPAGWGAFTAPTVTHRHPPATYTVSRPLAPPSSHYTTVHGRPPTPSPSSAPSLPPPRTNDSYGAYLLSGGGSYSYASDGGSGGGSGGGGGGRNGGGNGGGSSGGGGSPTLKLDYGVPLAGFHDAQSSTGSGTSINWSIKMAANMSLPLIPDVIPATGADFPDDGCARDQVRLRPTHSSYSAVQPCQPILAQGCCPDGQWVVVNEYTRMGECAPRLCPDGYAFIVRDGLCHDVQEEGLCPDGRRVYLTAFGQPRCGCKDGEYLDTHGLCRPVYSSGSCHYDQQLLFNTVFRLQCAPAVCPAGRPVPFQGWCKNFGDPCGDYRFLLGFDTTRLQPKCYLSEELEGGASSAPAPTITAPSAAPPTHRAPTAPTLLPTSLPPLQETYLPPPGQRTQYARRSGPLRPRAPAGRGSLAQWLGLSPRRRRPNRRRRPLRPASAQTPLLTPWSRLDIDQVTFVDSERISSDQLPRPERPERQQRQQPRRRRRFRRQIFANVPLLNTCKPGARSGANFKCRDKVLPGSSSRVARSPVPPSNAPTCPSGQILDPLGRCRQSGGGLGK